MKQPGRPPKLDDVFGFSVVRYENTAKFIIPPPPPMWKRMWYGLQTTWEEVIFPSILLALAVFCFELPFLLRH